MNQSIILGLLQNTAILLAFGMLYDHFWAWDEGLKSLLGKALTGFLLGGFAYTRAFTGCYAKTVIINGYLIAGRS